MTTTEITDLVFKTLLPGALAGASVAGLLSTWINIRLKASIENEYMCKLEATKADLKRDNDVYLAVVNAKYQEATQLLGHNLELTRLEKQIKFSGSYQKMLAAIESIHAKLIEIQRAMNAYTSVIELENTPSKKERREAVGARLKEFTDIFTPARIFFDENLDREIMAYIHKIEDQAFDFMAKIEVADKIESQAWLKIDNEVRDLWNTALASIRRKFRLVLGIEEVELADMLPPASLGIEN